MAASGFLTQPIDCVLGNTCDVFQLTDRDPGLAAQDFQCGPLTYDGHKGTDFAVPTEADMRRGVTVVAAAPGVVTATRDGMPDINMFAPGAPDLTGRECGNGVVIDHGEGWETQYCHLAQGSISVTQGDQVASGTPLGDVGLSGQTEFPHLHFAVRKDGDVVDPFLPDGSAACGTSVETLWSDPIPVPGGGIQSAGLLDRIPEFSELRAGGTGVFLARTDSPALVGWALIFGGRAGDVITITLEHDTGTVIDEAITLERTQAQLFRAAGLKIPVGGWPPGLYTGEIRMTRDGTQLDRARLATRIP